MCNRRTRGAALALPSENPTNRTPWPILVRQGVPEIRSRFRWDEELQRSRVQLTADAHQAWGEFLSPVPWDSFFTVTFEKSRKDAYYALQTVARVLSLPPGDTAFLAAEPHQSGDQHVHGLIHWAGGRVDMYNYTTWVVLQGSLGRASVAKPFAKADVVKYVTKYCTKALTDWLILGTLE